MSRTNEERRIAMAHARVCLTEAVMAYEDSVEDLRWEADLLRGRKLTFNAGLKSSLRSRPPEEGC